MREKSSPRSPGQLINEHQTGGSWLISLPDENYRDVSLNSRMQCGLCCAVQLPSDLDIGVQLETSSTHTQCEEEH